MFILLVHVQVNQELLGEFTSAILKNAAQSVERESGCVRFDVLQQENDPTKLVFYEVYENEKALVQHRASEHFLEFKKVADRALISRNATNLTGINVTS